MLRQVHHLSHPNVGKFLGVWVASKTCSLVCEHSIRGSLGNLMEQKFVITDGSIRLSFLYDLAKVILYLTED